GAALRLRRRHSGFRCGPGAWGQLEPDRRATSLHSDWLFRRAALRPPSQDGASARDPDGYVGAVRCGERGAVTQGCARGLAETLSYYRPSRWDFQLVLRRGMEDLKLGGMGRMGRIGQILRRVAVAGRRVETRGNGPRSGGTGGRMPQ